MEKFNPKKISALEILSQNITFGISFKIIFSKGFLDEVLDLVEDKYATRIENKEEDSEGNKIFYQISDKGLEYFNEIMNFAKSKYSPVE